MPPRQVQEASADPAAGDGPRRGGEASNILTASQRSWQLVMKPLLLEKGMKLLSSEVYFELTTINETDSKRQNGELEGEKGQMH